MLHNPKHEAFAREVAANEPVFGEVGRVLLAAMEKAGYVPSLPNARKLRQRPDIRDRVLKLRAAHAEFVCADIGRIVQEQAYIAFADIRDYFDWSGEGQATLKDLSTLPRSLTVAIREIKFDREGRPQIKLHDKATALAALQSYREQPRGQSNAPRKGGDAPSVPVPVPQHSDWAGLVAGDHPTSH
jgi:hypothetical protein